MENKKLDKIIEAFRRIISERIDEEGSPTMSLGNGKIAGTVEAGDDPPVYKNGKKYIHGFKRKPWLDYLKNK